jgi:hypothetical protein
MKEDRGKHVEIVWIITGTLSIIHNIFTIKIKNGKIFFS